MQLRAFAWLQYREYYPRDACANELWQRRIQVHDAKILARVATSRAGPFLLLQSTAQMERGGRLVLAGIATDV